MEDSFRVRVDKAFGALGGSTPSSVGVSPSLWSLTDEEIERREWNRHKEEAEERDDVVESGSSVVRNQLDSDLQDLSDYEEEEEEEEDEGVDGEKKKRRRNNSSSGAETSVDEYLDVQSNIGRDCTLDYEIGNVRNVRGMIMLVLLTFSVSDPERVVASVEPVDFGYPVDEAVNEERHGIASSVINVCVRVATAFMACVFILCCLMFGRFYCFSFGKKKMNMTKWLLAQNRQVTAYMRDVKFADYGIDEPNTYGELPNSFKVAVRDPRANHTAAKIRLKEDAEAAGSLDTLQLSDNHVAAKAETEDIKKGELDGDNPKPILKKRENSMDSKSQKRVRFMVDPESRAQTHEEEHCSRLHQEPLKIHTLYVFSSDDMDDQSNRKAYMDFFDQLRKRNTDSSQDDSSVEVPKSITFTPKRKPEDDSMVKRSQSEHNTGDNLKNKSWSIGVTAEDVQESEVSAMEEDEPSPAVDKGYSLQKPSRQYRMRTNVNGDDN
ncbi:UNVERIFIED_CONTAM: hypothetical protein Slati_1787900 [Sesamum latifolium]|uniref:U5 small nuclear ribonucleoprotein TSSC4 n=1 Tax=Sesamum latifolium TaxID=2727402 RepID=A0AAW2WYR9_9LAMI